MAFEVKMPQLSDTMSSGKILAWKKAEGDTIKRGDILAEVETDKANLEIESFKAGTLLKILIPAEQTATVGDIICVIGETGEAVGASAPNGAPVTQPVTTPSEVTISTPSTPAAPSRPAGLSTSERVAISPLARKLASQKNIDISTLHGSGPGGRIVKKDLDQAPSAPRSMPTAPRGPSTPPAPREEPQRAPRDPVPAGGRFTPLSKMRETIARRMQESVNESPHFYVTTAVRMDEAVRLREILKGKADYKGISVNHLIIKAVAYGLAHEPRVNCAMKDGKLYEPEGINIGVITAIEDGLLIPVIRDADSLSLKDIVFEARAAIERAKAGRPSSSDLLGGTFSISNMGMFDVENFTAIINPGQGGVIAVSSTREVPVVERGALVVGLEMKATVSVDHRVIDGVMAATFLKYFKEALETPALLMV